MRSYAERKAVPPGVLSVFQKVQALVAALPDLQLPAIPGDTEPEVSCHMLARAVAAVMVDLECVDGCFRLKGQEHSWLRFRDERFPWIIDVYPIAQVGGPFLVDASWYSPWSKLYLPAGLSIETRVGWEPHLRAVCTAVMETARDLWPQQELAANG